MTMGFWNIFRTNARSPDPDPPLEAAPVAPEPEYDESGGRLWRSGRAAPHACVVPDGHKLGLGSNNDGSIWRCPCGQRHRWVRGWIRVGVSLDDDADVLAGEKPVRKAYR